MKIEGFFYNPNKFFKLSSIQKCIEESCDAKGNVLSRKVYYRFTLYFDFLDCYQNREHIDFERYNKKLVYQTHERIKQEMQKIRLCSA